MDLQGELDLDLVEHVQDRVPAIGEVLVAGLDHCRRHGRESGQQVPDLGAGEAVDHLHAELGRGAGRVLDLLGGALAHAFRLAVAPDARGQDALVPLVNRVIAHALADQMGADGEAPSGRTCPAGRASRGRSESFSRALSTSKWSPQQASSRPSKPQALAFSASVFSGRSAHWPVKRVTGRAIAFLLAAL